MASLSLLAPAPLTVRRRVQPTPSADLSRMTRYRGGTYSHTVGTVVFADGTSARTDLIRLNPNIEAYSLDFSGVAPTTPSRYRADTWAAVPHLRARAHEAEVAWILRNSYPAISTTALSDDLRAAGYAIGRRNITEHEAIAGTQAAIWYLTNGLQLDVRPLNVPTRITEDARAVRVEFDGDRQLAGYAAEVSTHHGAVLTLQKSHDARHWHDVAASTVTVPAGGGRITKSLGVGSTVAHHRHGHPAGGYRHYRLVIDGDATIAGLTFRLNESRLYRNAEPVVRLYDYLLTGARAARRAAMVPELETVDAGVDAGLIGPLRLVISDAAAVRASDGYDIVGADGATVTKPIRPHEEFFLRAAPQSRAATLTVEIPGNPRGFGGRVITGVARDEVADSYTPVALAVPVQLVVEFDLDWAVAGSAAKSDR
ncbi:TQXA domain-containing protein [Mycolicibacterium sp. CH28]|uniref:thioester domain-containing protein n=1 Tax=Mycolicibacterium sp. CH28 TaxID=2512237 RepID=UPI001080B5C9|nr:thioester domain-containing protein [Mycolicibacterium sp. CH28]TGD90733.1 TQXA domain-containing protein [Mycolicibacterium sp. CH28]